MPGVAAGPRSGRVSRGTSTILRSEPFLASTNLASNSLTLGINRPTKYGSNPVAFSGLSTSDPNYGIGNNTAMTHPTDPNKTLFFHNSGDSAFTGVVVTYAESTDGTTLTRPTVGTVNWGGSTSNNIIWPTGGGDTSAGSGTDRVLCGNVIYDATDRLWYMVARPSSAWASLIYSASSPTGSWSLAKTVYAAHATSPSRDAQHLVRRSDGRWLLYYQRTETGLPQTGAPSGYYQGYRRSLGVFLSDTTSLTGAWTDVGAVLSSTSADRQYYGTGAWVDGQWLYVPVMIFDGTDSVPTTTSGSYPNTYNAIHKLSLYVAPASDGTTLTLADDAWLSRTGVYGEWDGGEITNGHNIVKSGNDWRFYFGGDGNTHHQSPENIRKLGFATIGYRRIGGVSGTGSVTTTTVSAPQGGALYVNGTNISNVELLDGSNNVLSGYGTANAVPADAYEHRVSWGAVTGVPTSFRVRVTVSSGAVNHVEVRS